MIRYADYTPPAAPSVVVGGKLVPYDTRSLHALAQNAMLLAVGTPRPLRVA